MSYRAPVLLTALLLLPLTASARGRTPIAFSHASCFNADISAYPLVTFRGPDNLSVTPFGSAVVSWHLTLLATPSGFEFVNGTFAFLIGGDVLQGKYTEATLDSATGAYTLKWKFDGGTGRFRRAKGKGVTNGVADLATYCAQYSFSGHLKGI